MRIPKELLGMRFSIRELMARCQPGDRATVLKILKEACIMQQQFPEAARLRDLESAARKKGGGK